MPSWLPPTGALSDIADPGRVLTAVTDCVIAVQPFPQQPTSKKGNMIHDPHTDVSEVRRPTPAEREVLGLLGLDPAPSPWVRLSLGDWRRVDDVVAALAAARRQPAVVPPQRGTTDAALTA